VHRACHGAARVVLIGLAIAAAGGELEAGAPAAEMRVSGGCRRGRRWRRR
jgi:hypothetical protein